MDRFFVSSIRHSQVTLVPLVCATFLLGLVSILQAQQEATPHKPDVEIRVNKQTDEHGNIIRYDSTYSWSYSSTVDTALNWDNLFPDAWGYPSLGDSVAPKWPSGNIFFNNTPSLDSMFFGPGFLWDTEPLLNRDFYMDWGKEFEELFEQHRELMKPFWDNDPFLHQEAPQKKIQDEFWEDPDNGKT